MRIQIREIDHVVIRTADMAWDKAMARAGPPDTTRFIITLEGQHPYRWAV